MQPYCDEIYVIPHSRNVNFFNAMRGLWSGLPVNVGYFFSPSTARKINGIIEKIKPDYIYVQLLRMAPYVQNIRSIDMAIDYMDAFSLRVMRRSRQSGLFLNLLWSLEAKLIARQEKSVAPRFKNRFIIAETDGDYLQREKIVNQLTLLKNGVDTEFYVPRDIPKKYDIVFVGNMSYHPNIIAAEYLVEHIVIPMRKKWQSLKVLIAGADPVASVRQLSGNGVEVSGFIEDIRDAYASGKIFVAPIFAGSGMQNKILEAMSMQLPCITSTQVIEAIGDVTNLLFKADDATEFIEHIERLLLNEAERQHVGMKCRKYIEQHLSWDVSCEPLNQLKA